VIRVFHCDDSLAYRRLVRAMLETEPDITIVGEAADHPGALAGIAEAQPDVVLLDLSMPQLDGLEVIARLRSVAPGVGIVVFSGFAAERMSQVAVDLGADRYLEKGEAIEVVRQTVREVARARRAAV
jgi:DNA-binding NarL/FixJ family response regulator